MIDARTLARPRGEWSFVFALAVAALPILGAIVAAWIELSQPGESAMWIVAGACFVVCPGLAAAASERTANPRGVRVAIALGVFAVLYAIWIANVPVPTQPGGWSPGTSRISGAVMAAGVAGAWLFATTRSVFWMRRGTSSLGFVLSAADLAFFSLVAFFVGLMIP